MKAGTAFLSVSVSARTRLSTKPLAMPIDCRTVVLLMVSGVEYSEPLEQAPLPFEVGVVPFVV